MDSLENSENIPNKNMKKSSKSLSTNNLLYESNNSKNDLPKHSPLNELEINKTIERCYKNLQEIKQKFFGSNTDNVNIFNRYSHNENTKLKMNQINNNINNNYENNNFNNNNMDSSPNLISNNNDGVRAIARRRMSYNSFNSLNSYNRSKIFNNNIINYKMSKNPKTKTDNFREDKKFNLDNNIFNNYNNFINNKKLISQTFLNKQYYNNKYNNNNFENFDNYQNKMLHNLLLKKNSQIEELQKENKNLKFQLENFLSQKSQNEDEKSIYFDKLIESKNEIIQLKKSIFEYQKNNKLLQEEIHNLKKELFKYKKNQTQNCSSIKHNKSAPKIKNKNPNIYLNKEEEIKKNLEMIYQENMNINDETKKEEYKNETILITNKKLVELNNQYKNKIKDYNEEIKKLNNVIKDKNNNIISLKKKNQENTIIINDLSTKQNENKDLEKNINNLIDENETNRKEIEYLKNRLKSLDIIENKYKDLISSKSSISEEKKKSDVIYDEHIQKRRKYLYPSRYAKEEKEDKSNKNNELNFNSKNKENNKN